MTPAFEASLVLNSLSLVAGSSLLLCLVRMGFCWENTLSQLALWRGSVRAICDHLMRSGSSPPRTNARTIRTTALALCYSTAEYAAPVWEKSAYAHLLNPELNQACRALTGCLKPTNVENVYLLAGIAPPEIRRSVCTRVERTKWVERERDPLPGWAHTSKKTSKVEKKLPYKCSTSSLPSKSCPSQQMEENTGGEGTCGLSQPVLRGSSHGA